MNREVEERVVAMYFDNEDFEKNAQTTINTLGQLKQGLNLEDSVKGFNVFEKLGKTLNFEKAEKSIGKIKSGLSSMNGALGKVFKIGDAPLREAEGMVNSIRGYLNKVIGFDFASKIVSSIENTVRGLTIAPVSAGWDQYQTKMDSVKTIMSSTGESIEVVEGHLKNLTDYANKTIYSLSDMTSNLGKFTNNGVKLEDSVKAMQGIANAAADAGQGSQQASMAMYNFSQAIGVGKMTSIDWKSIENANMATARLKNTFLEVAAAGGKVSTEIKKIGDKEEKTFWLTHDENGKKLKQKIQLTEENFREYLSKGWLDKNTMMRTLQIFSGEELTDDVFKSWGITDPELIKKFREIGANALESAQQVRTFQKMMDALKESVQSGWADSFQIIFGNVEQGTALWTDMNNRLDGILSASSDRRNKILKEWSEMTENDEAYWKKDEHNNTVRTGVEGGRDILIKSFFELMDVVQEFGTMLSDAFKSVFGELDAKKLFDITIKFRDFVKNLREWLGTTGDANSRMSKLQKGLKGVFSIIKAGIKIVKTIFNLLKRLFMPVLDFLIDKFGWIGGFFDGLGDLSIPEMFAKIGEGVSKAWDKIKGLFTKKEGQTEIPFVTKVKDTWNKFKTTVKGWVYDIGLGDVWEKVTTWWNNLKASFEQGWADFKQWWEDTGIGEWFRGIWNKIVGLFTAPSIENFLPEGYNGNVDLSVRPQVKMEIMTKRGWVDENGNPLGGDYATVLTNTFSVGKKSEGYDFEYKENATINITPILPNGDVLSPEELEDYIAELTRESLKTGKTIQELDKEKKGLLLSYDIVPEGMTLEEAYNEAGKWAENLHNLQEQWDQVKDKKSPIAEFFNNLKTDVDVAFKEVQDWWNKSGIPQFFTRMWNSIVGVFEPKLDFVTYDGTGRHEHYADSAIVSFFKNLWTNIDSAFQEVKKWWKKSGIPEFFTGMWNSIVGLFEPKLDFVTYDGTGRHEHYADSAIVSFFKNIWQNIDGAFQEVKKWWKKSGIPEFFTGMWNSVVGLFEPKLDFVTYDGTGRHEHYADSAIVSFFKNLWTNIDSAFQEVKKWWQKSGIPEFFAGMWNSVVGLFEPKLDFVTYDGTGRHEHYADSPIVSFFKNLWTNIQSIYDEISAWWGSEEVQGFIQGIKDFFVDIFDKIINLFGGGEEEAIPESGTNDLNKNSGSNGPLRHLARATDRFSTQVSDVGSGVKKIADNVPKNPEKTNRAIEIFKSVLTAIGDFFKTVFDAIKDVVITPEMTKFFDSMGTFISGMVNVLSQIMESFGKLMKGDFAGLGIGGLVTVVLSVAAVIIGIILRMKSLKYLSGIAGGSGQSFGLQFLEFAGGLLLIGMAMSLLTTLDQHKLDKAAQIMLVLGVVFGSIMLAIYKITSLSAPATVTGAERVLTNIINKLALFGIVWLVMDKIPEIIQKFQEFKEKMGGKDSSIGDDLLKTMLGIVALVGGISLVLALTNAIAPKGISPIATAKTIGSIIVAIALILGSFSGIALLVDALDDPKEASRRLNDLGEVLQSLGRAVFGFVAGMFGVKTDANKLRDAMDRTAIISEAANHFSMEEIAGISRMMTLISQLSDGSIKIDSAKISGFGGSMADLGGGIRDIARYITEVQGPLSKLDDPDSIVFKKLDGFVRFGKSLGELFGAMPEGKIRAEQYINGLHGLVENKEQFVSDLETMMQALGDIDQPETGIQFDGLTIAQKLFTEIQKGLIDPSLPAFDATPVVDAITKAIGLGDSAIALLVHNMVQNGIDLMNGGSAGPVKLTEDQIEIIKSLSQLNEEGTETDLDDMFDLSGLQEMLYGKDGKSGIVGELNGLKDEIPTVSEVFDGTGWMDFKDANGNEIDIVGQLQSHMAELSTTVNGMEPLKVTITPVFDLKNLTPEALQQALSNNPVPIDLGATSAASVPDMTNLQNSLNLDSVEAAIDGVKSAVITYVSNTTTAIGNLAGHMDGIAAEVKALKVYLDTGVLVGQLTPMIDKELYRRMMR